MIIEKMKTEKLLPADYNPRKDLKPGDAEYEKLKRSIEQFGYVEPVIWNKTTGRVVGGHQRLKVLIDMGINEVDCVIVEMDENKEKALNVALNKISGEWDKDKLALLITDLQAEDFDVSLTGFDAAEIDDLFKDTIGEKVKDDDFDVDAELQNPTITKLGDVWQLGRHRLVCGDATKPETYETLLSEEKVNLVITDPPYNVNYEGSAGKIKNDNMADDKFYNFLFDAFTNTEKCMADDASIYVFHADTEGLNFRKAFKDAGFYLSGTCIWKKQSLVLGRSPYQWQHVYIVIHDTGNTGNGANANAHFNYFNGGNRNSSADFFVDDTQVLQVNDYTKYYTWHCGDGKGKFGITNSNSIGIEICINSDGNYNAAFQNAVALTKHLMKELNIPLERVVRHYDASRKNCPASMSKNNWALWSTFKKRLTKNEEDLTMAQYDELKKEIGSIRTDVDKLKSKIIYAWVDDNMPDWAKPTVTKLMRKGYLKGDDEGKLNLDDNMLRILVINDRAGIYGE